MRFDQLTDDTETTLRICGAVRKIEEALPLWDLLEQGTPVWPVVKYCLVKQALRRHVASQVSSKSLEGYARIVAKPAPEKISQAQSDALSEAVAAACPDVLFVGNHGTLQEIGGTYYQTHIDPYRMEVENQGYRTLSLLAGVEADAASLSQGLWGRTLGLQPFMREAAVQSPPASCLEKAPSTLLSVINDCADTLGFQPSHLRAYMAVFIGRTVWAARRFQEMFARVRPRLVLMTNFASVYGWALCYACRKEGIPVIDIQHGVQSSFDGSYGFVRAPPDDWSLLPTGVISWTANDAARFAGAHESRSACVGGPSTFRLVQLLTQQSKGPAGDRLAASRRAYERASGELWDSLVHSQRPRVLVASQGPVHKALSMQLISGCRQVLYRVHPTQVSAELEHMAPEFAKTTHAALASRALLPAVLAASDVVITGYSAVFLEASLLGIPTVFTSSVAGLLSQDYPEIDPTLVVDPNRGELEAALGSIVPAKMAPYDRLERGIAGLPDLSRIVEDLIAQA